MKNKIIEFEYKKAKSFYNKIFEYFLELQSKKLPKILTKKKNLIILKCEFLFSYKSKRMTKKEYMLQIINLLPDWKMGRGLKALIENNQLSTEVFDKLYEIFKQNIYETYNEKQKKDFKEKLQKIEAMKQQEAKQSEEELIDLDEMLSTL